MNDNTYWAIFWICVTIMISTISVCTYFSGIDTNTRRVAEYKAAADNGLQQQYIGDKVIWVKK